MELFGWAADYYGCGYYRIGLPMWALRECAGAKTRASAQLQKSWERDADIIVGQRVCIDSSFFVWERLAQENKPLVFEIDDDLWQVHASSEQSYEFFKNQWVKDRLRKSAELANAVTVSTDYLANVLRPINPNVHVLPNYLAAATFDIERPKRDQLTLGWAGSATHHIDFMEVAPHLRRFFRRNPEVDMHFIGFNYGPIVNKKSRFTKWSKEVIKYYQDVDFDIGIAPLKNNEFNRAKSPLKALEYAAFGIPVVASNVLPYRNFIEHGVTGFLVDSGWEWGKYLQMLVDDPELRLKMGQAAKESVADYTIQKNIVKWYAVYDSVLEARNAQQ